MLPSRASYYKRVCKALDLQVRRIGKGEYEVSGGASVQYVDVNAGDCSCEDRDGQRAQLCKHWIAVSFYRTGVLQAWKRATEEAA